MQDHFDDHFYQTTTELLGQSLGSSWWLGNSWAVGERWAWSSQQYVETFTKAFSIPMAWKQMGISLQQWKETFQFGCVCLWNKCLQRKPPFGLLEYGQTKYVFTEESSTTPHCKYCLFGDRLYCKHNVLGNKKKMELQDFKVTGNIFNAHQLCQNGFLKKYVLVRIQIQRTPEYGDLSKKFISISCNNSGVSWPRNNSRVSWPDVRGQVPQLWLH